MTSKCKTCGHHDFQHRRDKYECKLIGYKPACECKKLIPEGDCSMCRGEIQSPSNLMEKDTPEDGNNNNNASGSQTLSSKIFYRSQGGMSLEEYELDSFLSPESLVYVDDVKDFIKKLKDNEHFAYCPTCLEIIEKLAGKQLIDMKGEQND